jgi:hypothetical protein
MKQTAILDHVQANLRPGVITQSGFLGQDTRPLVDILEADNARVQRLGLTHLRIADAMRRFREAGAEGLGEPVTVPPHFEVRVDGVRGKLPCPFDHKGLYPKVNTVVRNTALGREVTYTDLNIHMIEAHGFYQGHGALFHTEPEDLARILEIAPDDAEVG